MLLHQHATEDDDPDAELVCIQARISHLEFSFANWRQRPYRSRRRRQSMQVWHNYSRKTMIQVNRLSFIVLQTSCSNELVFLMKITPEFSVESSGKLKVLSQVCHQCRDGFWSDILMKFSLFRLTSFYLICEQHTRKSEL